MLPDFPIAKEEIRKNIRSYLETKIKYFSGQPFGDIHRRQIHEGDGLHIIYEDGMVKETKMKPIHSKHEFHVDQMIKNPSLKFEILDELAKDMAFAQTKMIITEISEVTEKVGNNLKVEDKFSTEVFLNVMRKITIDFNQDGSPRLPTIIISPENRAEIDAVMKKAEQDIEFNKEFLKIIEEKRRIWNDRESNRKLVG